MRTETPAAGASAPGPAAAEPAASAGAPPSPPTSPPAPSPLRWETITKARFDEIDRGRAVVLVSCSPIEVHGPHLPMGADALEADGLAERMLRFLPARHRDRTFLKLPFVYVATDVLPQPGSLHFRPETIVAVLGDLGRTLAAQGFRDIWVSSFHGSVRHFVAIETACARSNRRSGTRMVSLFSLMLARLRKEGGIERALAAVPGVRAEDLKGDVHAGLVETAQLLSLHPDWVDPGYPRLERRAIEEPWLTAAGARGRSVWQKARDLLGAFRDGARYFRTETYSGAPAGASAEMGERILDALASRTGAACGELLDGALAPEACHSPMFRFRFLLHPLLSRLTDWLIGFRPIA